jgi:hypothetical protein
MNPNQIYEKPSYSLLKFESKHVSDGATVTLNCCSFIIPITLIACGAVLVSNPSQNTNYQGILIAYFIIGSLTLISSLCQICCISLAQCGSLLNCCKYMLDVGDKDDFKLAPAAGYCNTYIIQWIQLCFSCIHIVGPIMLFSGGIALSASPIAETANGVGIASIVIGSFLFFSYIFSCLTICCAHCFNVCCVGGVMLAESK